MTSNLALASEGLVIALDQLGSPAFVTDGTGKPVYANTLGSRMFDRDPSGIAKDLRKRIKRPAAADVREIRAKGQRPHWLVVIPTPAVTPEDKLETARHVWQLTTRQVDVLRLVVKGEPNKGVAQILDCAEVTIEFHMTALLRKAGVESRAQLVARFWGF